MHNEYPDYPEDGRFSDMLFRAGIICLALWMVCWVIVESIIPNSPTEASLRLVPFLSLPLPTHWHPAVGALWAVTMFMIMIRDERRMEQASEYAESYERVASIAMLIMFAITGGLLALVSIWVGSWICFVAAWMFARYMGNIGPGTWYDGFMNGLAIAACFGLWMGFWHGLTLGLFTSIWVFLFSKFSRRPEYSPAT